MNQSIEEHYKTLGFDLKKRDPDSITLKEARQAYGKKASKYHEDKLTNATEAEKLIAKEKLQEITIAYNAIRKTKRTGDEKTLDCRIFFSAEEHSYKRKLKIKKRGSADFYISVHTGLSEEAIRSLIIRGRYDAIDRYNDTEEEKLWRKEYNKNTKKYLAEVAEYLEKDFPEKHRLNEDEYSDFLYYMSNITLPFGSFGREVITSATLKNGTIGFSKEDKETFEANLRPCLQEFRQKKKKSDIASGIITTAVGAGIAYNAMHADIIPPRPDIEQVHHVQAENRSSHYPRELETLTLKDRTDPQKIKTKLASEIEVSEGREYYEAFNRRIYLDNPNALGWAAVQIEATIHARHNRQIR